MKDKFRLVFEKSMPVLLVRTRLTGGDAKGAVGEVNMRCHQLAHPEEKSFRWGKSMKALTLAVLRIKIGMGREPLLSGYKGSTVATLDNLVHKAFDLHWLEGMLTLGGLNARMRLETWFERQNSQGNNKSKPIRIFAREGARCLEGGNIEIWLGEREATRVEVLELERNLAAELSDETAAPAGMAAAKLAVKKTPLRVSGGLPGAGSLVVGREEQLTKLDLAAAAGSECRIYQVIAPGGCGKTALARHWLEKRLAVKMEGGNGEELPWERVFVWSFYRQGFQSDSVQPMWPFRQALAESLGVELANTASATQMVELLCEGFE